MEPTSFTACQPIQAAAAIQEIIMKIFAKRLFELFIAGSPDRPIPTPWAF